MLASLSLVIAILVQQGEAGERFAATALELQIEAERQRQVALAAPASSRSSSPEETAFLSQLSSFADQAMALSVAIDERQGPEDLRCIFRGMAIDALEQHEFLGRAELNAGTVRILERLEYLFEHAAQIGPIADQADIEPFTGVAPDCPRGPL